LQTTQSTCDGRHCSSKQFDLKIALSALQACWQKIADFRAIENVDSRLGLGMFLSQ